MLPERQRVPAEPAEDRQCPRSWSMPRLRGSCAAATIRSNSPSGTGANRRLSPAVPSASSAAIRSARGALLGERGQAACRDPAQRRARGRVDPGVEVARRHARGRRILLVEALAVVLRVLAAEAGPARSAARCSLVTMPPPWRRSGCRGRGIKNDCMTVSEVSSSASGRPAGKASSPTLAMPWSG